MENICFLENDKNLINADFSARRRFHKSYINIDSRFRVKETCVDEEKECVLSKDPLMFMAKSKKVFIQHEDHPFKNGDKIKLNYIRPKSVTLRSIINTNHTFSIEPNSNVMTINYKHNLSFNYDSDSNLQVEIIGIKGDNDCIGNIPINVINGKHKIHIKIDDTYKPSNDKFYIILPFTRNDEQYYLKKYNFKIVFHYIAGIPIDYFTTDYHCITHVNDDDYCIRLPTKATMDGYYGGSNITVAKIKSIKFGSNNPNKYCIDLGETFNNIVTTRLVNTIFPKTHGYIKIENNIICWNNIDDGDQLHSVNIPNGYYSISELINTIQKTILDNKNQYMEITIDEPSGTVTFRSFKKFNLIQPIIKVTPEIIDLGIVEEIDETDKEYTLIIEHADHHLTQGKEIIIKKSLAHMGIPEHIINKKHIISKIINDNQYEIILPKNSFNLEKERINTKGGFSVEIEVPMLFRLRFDQEGTIGDVLGFKNNITDFNTVIKNSTNGLKLVTNEYIYMIANPLHTINAIGNVKQAFGKIILVNKYGNNNSNLLYDTFVPSEKVYETPIREISQLEIEFLLPDGTLYDFHGLEHSFVIEIVTVNDIPNRSGYSSQTGRNYNPLV